MARTWLMRERMVCTRHFGTESARRRQMLRLWLEVALPCLTTAQGCLLSEHHLTAGVTECRGADSY